MPYSMQDVDEAEALVRKIRPETLISRDDYDWTLVIKDKDSNFVVILFQCGDESRREITTSSDEIRDICFLLGSQWTPEQVATRGPTWPRSPDN